LLTARAIHVEDEYLLTEVEECLGVETNIRSPRFLKVFVPACIPS